MSVQDEIRLVVDKESSPREIETDLNEIWAELTNDLSKLDIKELSTAKLTSEQLQQLRRSRLTVKSEGAGVDPATIALIVSLTPIVKALAPVLKPVVKDASDVAHRVALDLWEIAKKRLWKKYNIKLKQK